MIQKLRRKFVAVVMGASALLLLAVFVALLVSTYNGMARQNREMLEMELDVSLRRENKQPPENGSLSQPQTGQWRKEKNAGKGPNSPNRLPIFIATVAENGSIALQEEQASFLLEELEIQEIEDLARQAVQSPENFGILSAHRLRWLKRETESGTRIAFADTSSEVSAMGELVKNSLILGSVTLLLLFGVSLLLARWAVKPVETAWQQQNNLWETPPTNSRLP